MPVLCRCGSFDCPWHVAPLKAPEPLRFDWLRDYGPLWEPGSTAFWLEPDTGEELNAWHVKYRPVRKAIDQQQSMYDELNALLQQGQYYANQLQQSQMHRGLQGINSYQIGFLNTLTGSILNGKR